MTNDLQLNGARTFIHILPWYSMAGLIFVAALFAGGGALEGFLLLTALITASATFALRRLLPPPRPGPLV